VTVSLKNNTNQSLSIYYYEGGKEKLLELSPNQSIQMIGIDSLSPSTERLITSKYLRVTYSVAPTVEATPIHVRGMAWADQWNQNVDYLAGYVTGYYGSIWLSRKPSRGSEPTLISPDWELIGVQDISSLLALGPDSLDVGSIIYRTGTGWTSGPISDDSIIGLISIGKINGLSDSLDEKLSRSASGQIITGTIQYMGAISGADSLVNKEYVDQKLSAGGGLLTGAVTYDPSVPISNAYQLVTKTYVDNQLLTFVPLSGNVSLTGPLTLFGPPIASLHAATKSYVDAQALAGGTLTGKLKLPTGFSITDNTDLTNKLYVDAQALAGGTLTGKLKLPTGFSITDNTDLTNKLYVDAQALAGGTLTGKLKLPVGIAILDNDDLTNKLYVDSAVSGAVPKTGGLVTGLLYYRIPKTGISASASTDIFSKQNHGMKSGRAVTAVSLPLPGFGGISSGPTYYIILIDSDRFKLAATFGNSTTGDVDQTQLTTSSTDGLTVGMPVTGVGFASGTVITSIDSQTTFSISIPLEQSQPRVIDITSDGAGASFIYVDQRSDDSIPTKDYIDDLLGISGEVLLTAGGTMTGLITGDHGLVQSDGDKRMTGALVVADLPDVSPGSWSIIGFSVDSATETRVYITDIQDWKSYHDIEISGTTLYNGTYEVVSVNTSESYLVIDKEFAGSGSGGTATQKTNGLYYSTSEGGISYQRRRFLTKGTTVLIESDYDLQSGDGTILSASNGVSVLGLGDPAESSGQVVVKKVGDASGASVIVDSGAGGGDSNLVLDTINDSVTLEPVRDNPGEEPPVFKWQVVSRVRNGENTNRVIFNGSILVGPGRTDIDITSNKEVEKTTKVSAVANSSGNLEMTVADASAFSTATLISVEGSINGYNGNYPKSSIVSVNTGTNKITLSNINAVSIVTEAGFFLVARVYEPMKSNLAAGSSTSSLAIRDTTKTSKIAGFSSGGTGFTNIIIGDNIDVVSVENVPVVVTGVVTTGAGPYTLYRLAHGFSNGDYILIEFTSGFDGLVTGSYYYVTNATANEFELEGTLGGGAVLITGAGVDATVINTTMISGQIRVVLDETGFLATHPDGFGIGDRVNIQWESTYNGSYLVESFEVPEAGITPPAVIINKDYSVPTTGSAKLSKAVPVSDWLPEYHSLRINGTTYYDTPNATTPLGPSLDLISVDDIYSTLTMKAPYNAGEPYSGSAMVYGMVANNIFQHPNTLGKVLSGDGNSLVTTRTDGDGDLTLRLSNRVLVDLSSTNITDISRELSGSHLHMISGGVFDVKGRVSGTVSAVAVYSSSITSGGANTTLTLQNILDFRIGDVVQLTGESSTRRITAVASTTVTVSGSAYTPSGSSSVTNLSVIQLTLNDIDTNIFKTGDQVLIKGVTSLGGDYLRGVVSAASSLVVSPYAAPRITLRGFNKTSINDTNTTDPISGVTSSVANNGLTFPTTHNLVTGQAIRLEFQVAICAGMTLTTNIITGASVYTRTVYAVKTEALVIQLAGNQTDAYNGVIIDISINGDIGSVTPLVTIENPFDPSESVSGTVEVPPFLNAYTVRPWLWLSWRSTFLLTGPHITSWSDYSGNSRDFIATSNWPHFKNGSSTELSFNGVLGIKCAEFAANRRSSYTLPAPKSQAISIVLVAKTSDTNGVILESGSIVLSRGASTYTLAGASGTSIAGGTPGTAAAVYTLVLNGTSSRFRKFISFSTSPQEATGNISGGLTTSLNLGKTSGGFAGDVAAMLVFERALNDDQIAFLERSLAYEHGIS